MWREYVFEVTVRETVIAKSEEEARQMLPPTPDGHVAGWQLVNVQEGR